MLLTILLPPPKNDCELSVNDFSSCTLDNQRVMQLCQPIMIVSAAFMGRNAEDDIATACYTWASTRPQWILVLHHWHLMRCGSEFTQNQWIGCLSGQNCYQQYRYHLLRMSSNVASTIFGLASWIIQGLWNGVTNPWSTSLLPGQAQKLVTISYLPHTIECPLSLWDFCGGSLSYTAMTCIALFLHWVLRSQCFEYVLVYNFTNMHAMSHRSDILLLVALQSIFENPHSTLL